MVDHYVTLEGGDTVAHSNTNTEYSKKYTGRTHKVDGASFTFYLIRPY